MKYKSDQNTPLKLLDVVALLQDIPEEKLARGQVGTIVEELDDHAFEVEFADKEGRTITSLALNANELMALKFQVDVVL